MRIRTVAAVGGALTAAVIAALSRPAQRRYLTWGATADEAYGPMPGDELLPAAETISTRAISIGARPVAVWPWLVQMGSGRGGAYTYDWIENLLGLNMHSADEILPQFQDLAVGDVLPLGRDGPDMRVEICDRDRTLALRSTDGAWVWTFDLRPDGDRTRLISRNRIQRLPYSALMAPGSLVMEHRMLRGIRRRAERTTPPSRADAAAASARRPPT
ncbi:SRPBCC family protein [Actinoplanes sp. CA-054009]